MSMIIKGMDMPKHKGKSLLPDLHRACIKVYSTGECEIVLMEGKEHFPLVEVPTPHGRMIDADDIDNITVVLTERGTLKRIDAPTIVEAEVKT